MGFTCKSWSVNVLDQDKQAFVEEYISRKKKGMSSIFGKEHSVKITNNGRKRVEPIINVLSNIDYMQQIFNKLEDRHDKANVAQICGSWAHMFLLENKDDPRIANEFESQLEKTFIHGVEIVVRKNKVLSRRCVCYKTFNMAAREVLHLHQMMRGAGLEHLTEGTDKNEKRYLGECGPEAFVLAINIGRALVQSPGGVIIID